MNGGCVPIPLTLRVSHRSQKVLHVHVLSKDEDRQGRLGLNSDLAMVQQMKSRQMRSMARGNGRDFRNSQLDALVLFRFSEDPTRQVSSLLQPPVPSLHPALEGCVCRPVVTP